MNQQSYSSMLKDLECEVQRLQERLKKLEQQPALPCRLLENKLCNCFALGNQPVQCNEDQFLVCTRDQQGRSQVQRKTLVDVGAQPLSCLDRFLVCGTSGDLSSVEIPTAQDPFDCGDSVQTGRTDDRFLVCDSNDQVRQRVVSKSAELIDCENDELLVCSGSGLTLKKSGSATQAFDCAPSTPAPMQSRDKFLVCAEGGKLEQRWIEQSNTVFTSGTLLTCDGDQLTAQPFNAGGFQCPLLDAVRLRCTDEFLVCEQGSLKARTIDTAEFNCATDKLLACTDASGTVAAVGITSTTAQVDPDTDRLVVCGPGGALLRKPFDNLLGWERIINTGGTLPAPRITLLDTDCPVDMWSQGVGYFEAMSSTLPAAAAVGTELFCSIAFAQIPSPIWVASLEINFPMATNSADGQHHAGIVCDWTASANPSGTLQSQTLPTLIGEEWTQPQNPQLSSLAFRAGLYTERAQSVASAVVADRFFRLQVVKSGTGITMFLDNAPTPVYSVNAGTNNDPSQTSRNFSFFGLFVSIRKNTNLAQMIGPTVAQFRNLEVWVPSFPF